MKPEHEQYILRSIGGRRSVESIARDLGIKEREVEKFLERQGKYERKCVLPHASGPGKGKVLLSALLIVILGFAIYGNFLHVKVYNSLGVAYINLGRKEEAERLFKKAIRLDPDHEMAYGNLAILYFGQQKYDRAVEYYEKAEKLGFVDPKFLQKITPYRGKPREFAP